MSFGRGLTRRRLGAAPRRRSGAGRRRRPGASPRLRLGLAGVRLRVVLATLLGVGVLLAGAWFWVRDSSLVSVDRVSVSGQSGPDAGAIRSALISAARNMTTLDVRIDQLRAAVYPFPEVKDVQVSTQFPHGMRIRVIEQLPVAAITVGGRRIAVSADGTLLHDVAATSSLPLIPMAVPPGGTRLTEPSAVGAVALLGAAPYQLLSRISQVTTVSGHGLVAQIRGGPSVYFGDASQLRPKWISAAAVLADPGAAGAVYIDVTDPVRPAAGAGGGAGTGSGTGTSTAAASGTPGVAGTGTGVGVATSTTGG